MRITENNVNRYINLLSSGSASGNNALKVSISDETFKAEREKTWQDEPLTVSAGSYIPNITYNMADTGESIEKVSIVNGICSDAEKAHEYTNIVYNDFYRHRDEIDYSGMSGGEIISAVVDTYNKYFDFDNIFELHAIKDAHSNLDEDFTFSIELKQRVESEISYFLKKYNIKSAEAFSEHYGYSDMTAEEKRDGIISEYCDDGIITYEDYFKMLDKMWYTGAISMDEYMAAETDVYNKFLYGNYRPDQAVNFNKLLEGEYNVMNTDHSQSGMTEKAIKILINDTKARIMVFENILNILERNNSNE